MSIYSYEAHGPGKSPGSQTSYETRSCAQAKMDLSHPSPHTRLQASNQTPTVGRMFLGSLIGKLSATQKLKAAEINSCEVFCGKVSVDIS